MVSWCFDLVYAIFTTMHESFLPMYFLDLWQQSLKGRFIFRLSERGIWLSWNENLCKTHLREQRESPFPNFYFQCIISWVYWWDCFPIILKSSSLNIININSSLCEHKQAYSWVAPVDLPNAWGKEASVIVYPKGSTMVLSQQCSASCLSAISEDHLSLGMSLSIALLTSKSDTFQRSD